MRETNNSGGTCSFCDRTVTATWRAGGNVVAVCEDCGVTVLPALASDSIFVPKVRAADEAKRKERELRLHYWRGLALRLIREAEEK